MAASTKLTNATIKKKPAGGRKGKKAWKKNVDISNIEEAIDQIRTEKILTGSAIVDKSNDSLFIIDKKGDEKAKTSLRHRKLRIDQILEAKSGVSGIPSLGKKSKTVALEDEKTLAPGKKAKVISKNVMGQINKLAKKITEGKIVKQVAIPKSVKRAAAEIPTGDLWGASGPIAEVTEDDPNDYLAHLKPKKVKKPSVPNDRPTHIPAVKVSHSGSSYNPTFKDHQGLLQAALDVELEKERKNEEFKQRMSYPPELDNIDDENFFESDEEEVTEEPNEGEDVETVAKKLNANVRKTRTERNKEAAKIARARAEQKLKDDAKLRKQIHELEIIKKELANQPAKPEKKDKKRQMKLGPLDFKPAPLEITLTEDLPESLLKLKPEGNLFTDRFQSLQERSIIEPRVPVGKRVTGPRWKRKETERHDYKRFDAETYANL
ncbi:UNVERIFIED_CONTAM: hypothetical protein HDU68_010889 [Siphonaria sp. JEL0065]|nr:hypothetical protein HDU68_010889 [Siphonaria sp. JEL0065]